MEMAVGSRKRIEALEPALAQRVRAQARRLGVSAATLFHAAWGWWWRAPAAGMMWCLGRVLLGRLQGSAGAQRILGMFINTLPLRLRLQEVTAQGAGGADAAGAGGAAESRAGLAGGGAALQWYRRIGAAVQHAAELSAQRCRVRKRAGRQTSGIQVLAGQERTNYPITVSVDDLGEGLR